MDVLAPISRHLVAPLWAAWEGSAHLRHHRALKRSQFDSPDAVRARQLDAVRAIVAHARATVPYYRRLPDIRSLDDLRQVPILTKQHLRDHFDDLLSDAFRGQKLHLKKTSGSTGVPVRVLLDDAGMQFKRGATLRSDEWSGWRLGQRAAKVWGNPEYRQHGWRGRLRNLLLERADYLDTLKMTDADVAAFAERLRRRRPGLIFGHAHSVYLLAESVRNHGPAGIRPRGVICTAMVLHDWQRRVIEEVFACPATNRYGCEEVSLIASECERHRGLHVNAEGVLVEIIADGRPARPGEPGAVVVTDLANRAMPLIRYQVGDVAAWAEAPCPCGRGLPTLARLEGREADYVVTEAGERVSGISLTENFAMQVPGVAQMQIVQETVTRFTFRVVRAAGFDPAALAALVRERFGPRTRHAVEFVDAIAPEPSGKYRFCISKVAPARG